MTMKTQTGRKLFKRSTIAACVMAATAAHVQAQETNSDDPALLEEVVVYGIQQSLQNAQDIKREASTVKDVITASDIGALPDKSVVEALQRVPGVAIERFEASGDPDHFAVEGGGVTIRGLNRVRSEFNGRDSFSAGAEGGLNFSDIPPEMIGSVEVVKNSTADVTEGGTSGTINLITRKPFDKEEFQAFVTAKGSYGDLIEDWSPSISGLVSNVWETDAGKFGALLSISASNLTTQGDGIGIYNYFETQETSINDSVLPIVPAAPSVRQQQNDRDRLGLTGSLQWANPSETVKATLEFIRSDSTLSWSEHYVEFPEQPFNGPFDGDGSDGTIGLGDDYTFDCPEGGSVTRVPCHFTSGTFNYNSVVQDAGWAPRPPTFFIAGARSREDERTINDISFNLEYAPNDNLTITTDFQLVDATATIKDLSAMNKFYSNVYLDLRSKNEPRVEFIDTTFGDPNGDAANYYAGDLDQASAYAPRSAMDHFSDNEGTETAFQIDGKYLFDDAWVTSVEAGLRVSNKEVDFQESTYNWGSISERWAGPSYINDNVLATGYAEQYSFGQHFDGNALTQRDTFWFPALSALEDNVHLNDIFNSPYTKDADGNTTATIKQTDDAWVPAQNRPGVMANSYFLPSEVYNYNEDRSAAYVRVDFGSEDSDIRYSGNAGLRYVSWQLENTGAINFPSISPQAAATNAQRNAAGLPGWTTPLPADVVNYSTDSAGDPTTITGEEFTRVLPSFNLKIELTDELIMRVAASEAIYLPTLLDVRNQRNIGSRVETEGQAPLYLVNSSGEAVDADGATTADPVYVSFTQPDTPDLSLANYNPADPSTYYVATEATAVDYPSGVKSNGFFANGAGNPNLQPELSSNYDLAFEWYFDDLGSFTSTFFYKNIRNFLRDATTTESVYNPRADLTQDVTVTQKVNAGKARVQGYELAYQGTFGWMHESLENFGIQTSYTFVDGRATEFSTGIEPVAPPADATDEQKAAYNNAQFRNFPGLPIEGLSKHNSNLVLFYDNGTFQTRFAYSHRSSYLLDSRDVIAFAAVYGEGTGQLDWSASYSITDQIKVGIEANNLLNEVTRTSIQHDADGNRTPRSFFMNDRRFGLSLQAVF